MKSICILLAVLMTLAACTGKNKGGKQTPELNDSGKAVRILCFEKLGGTANQDTSSVRLHLAGDKVSGEFSIKLFEKDSRVGTVQAVRENDLIKGLWFYMQEGIKDTLDIEFKLSDDKLVQKNYTVDPKTGREVFSEGSVFNIVFQKVDCRE